MLVAGIDAHATYLVVAIVSNDGALVRKPHRVRNDEPERLVKLLKAYRPLKVVVETSPAWPWLYDLLEGRDCHFVLAHANRLRVIACLPAASWFPPSVGTEGHHRVDGEGSAGRDPRGEQRDEPNQ